MSVLWRPTEESLQVAQGLTKDQHGQDAVHVGMDEVHLQAFHSLKSKDSMFIQ